MLDRRNVFLSLAALPCLSLAASAAEEPGDYDAVVSRLRRRAFVRVPHFSSVAAALDSAPRDGAKPYRILVSAGTWRERVTVDKPNVRLIGEGRDRTAIVFNLSAGDPGTDGKPIGTFGTPTATIAAPDFRAEHIAFANDFDYPGHLPSPTSGDKTGSSGAQAVALAVTAAADRSRFVDVGFQGYQDTLFVDAGRSLFSACRIEGCVDFVFGQGRAAFDACEIVSRLRPGQDFQGYVAAPDTNVGQLFGFVFTRCRLTKAAGVGAHTVALGRPWRRTASKADGHYGDPEVVPACAYLQCWMDDHIVPAGWLPMGYTARWGQRTQMTPQEARFYEFASEGPGSGPPSATRRFLTPMQAALFDRRNVLEGWGG